MGVDARGSAFSETRWGKPKRSRAYVPIFLNYDRRPTPVFYIAFHCASTVALQYTLEAEFTPTVL